MACNCFFCLKVGLLGLVGLFMCVSCQSEKQQELKYVLQETEDALSDFIVDMNLKYDKVFSVIDIDIDNYEKWKAVTPFYKNVKQDGIVLWKVA